MRKAIKYELIVCWVALILVLWGELKNRSKFKGLNNFADYGSEQVALFEDLTQVVLFAFIRYDGEFLLFSKNFPLKKRVLFKRKEKFFFSFLMK